MRRPPVVLGMAAITILALLIAVALILFSVNPSVDRNTRHIEDQQAFLIQTAEENRALICAQVQTTANAYRFRSLTPSGQVEPIRHFLTRMQAQRQTLRLAKGKNCKSAPGFPPFGLQVRRALAQINRILLSFEPRLREPIRRGISATPRQESFSPSFLRPPRGGIGEEGVPAHLAPELAPQSPQEAPERNPKPAAPPQEPNPRPTPEPEQIPGPSPPPIVPAAPEPKPMPVGPPPHAKGKIEVPGLIEGEFGLDIPKTIMADVEVDLGEIIE